MTTRLAEDVLIIGSGPAGSAAALCLARAGLRVTLVDRHAFPRDKVCGDALIPDALQALESLGLRQRVLAEAARLPAIRIYAPNASYVSIDAEIACLQRHRFDDLLRKAAIEAGARFLAPLKVLRPMDRDGTVAGAVFASGNDERELRLSAEFTVLATGAAAAPLESFGVCERREPSAMAARIYVRASDRATRDMRYLCISYDKHICPGYGWIFPGPGNVFNVGVGYFKDTRKKPPTTNLRELLARFVETFPPARALFQDSRPLTDVRGAPLRTALAGARLSLPGLFVVGEAAGLTYSFSGEGIGKAIESGMIAAESISAAFSTSLRDKSAIAHAYAQRIVSHFEDRFGAYRLAQGWLASPMIANFLAWRANSGDYVRTQMEALLNETADPRVLFSAGGLLRSLSRWTANARRRTPGRPRCSSASTRSSPRLMSPWS